MITKKTSHHRRINSLLNKKILSKLKPFKYLFRNLKRWNNSFRNLSHKYPNCNTKKARKLITKVINHPQWINQNKFQVIFRKSLNSFPNNHRYLQKCHNNKKTPNNNHYFLSLLNSSCLFSWSNWTLNSNLVSLLNIILPNLIK